MKWGEYEVAYNSQNAAEDLGMGPHQLARASHALVDDAVVKLKIPDATDGAVVIVDSRTSLVAASIAVVDGEATICLDDFADDGSAKSLRSWSYEVLLRKNGSLWKLGFPERFPKTNASAKHRHFQVYNRRTGECVFRSHPHTAKKSRTVDVATSGVRNKNVVVFTKLVSYGAGQTTAVINVANMLASQGYRVTLLALYHSERESVTKLRDDVAFDYLDGSRKRNIKKERTSELSETLGFATSVTQERLVKYLSRNQIDLIYLPAYDGPLARMIKENANPNTILILGDHDGDRLDRALSNRLQPSYKYAAENFHAVHCVNPVIAKGLHRLGVPTFYIPNCVSETEDREQPAWASRTVVCAGRITERKGTAAVVAAFAALSDKHPEWKLDILGRGDESEKHAIQSIVRQKQLEDRVFMHGFVSDTSPFYKSSAISASASLVESFGLSTLEAMEAGCLVVSYDGHEGARLLLNEDNSILCEHKNHQAFIRGLDAAMTMIETDPEACAAKIAAGHRTAENYHFSRIALEWDTKVRSMMVPTESGSPCRLSRFITRALGRLRR